MVSFLPNNVKRNKDRKNELFSKNTQSRKAGEKEENLFVDLYTLALK